MCIIFAGLLEEKELQAGQPAAEQPAREPEKTAAMLAETMNLQNPAIPLDFVDWTILCTGSDRLLSWMHQNNIPEAAKWLFNYICFFNIYRFEAAKNGGKVTQELNETAKSYLIDALNCMQELGERW
jgi:hypothetical protein